MFPRGLAGKWQTLESECQLRLQQQIMKRLWKASKLAVKLIGSLLFFGPMNYAHNLNILLVCRVMDLKKKERKDAKSCRPHGNGIANKGIWKIPSLNYKNEYPAVDGKKLGGKYIETFVSITGGEEVLTLLIKLIIYVLKTHKGELLFGSVEQVKLIWCLQNKIYSQASIEPKI